MISNTNEPELKTPDSTPVQPESERQPVTEPVTGEAVKPQLGRFQRFGRSALIWLAVVVIAALAGVLTFYFMSYQPLTKTLTQTQGELAQANQTVSDLKTKLSAANDQVTGLRADNESKQTELEAATAHLALQQVLVDITNARMALLNDDVLSAKTALKQTAQQLDTLAPHIAEVDAKLAESMPQRLTLVLSELDSNVETAKVDLELLAGNLLNVETLLFKK